MAQKKVPGMALAVIDNGKAIFKQGYGFSNIEKQSIVDTKTGFNIGSISKVFTAIGIMKLVEEGTIGLDVSCRRLFNTMEITRYRLRQKQSHHKTLIKPYGGHLRTWLPWIYQ